MTVEGRIQLADGCALRPSLIIILNVGSILAFRLSSELIRSLDRSLSRSFGLTRSLNSSLAPAGAFRSFNSVVICLSRRLPYSSGLVWIEELRSWYVMYFGFPH